MNKFITLIFLTALMPLVINAKSINELTKLDRQLSNWGGYNHLSLNEITDFNGIENLEVKIRDPKSGALLEEEVLLSSVQDLSLEFYKNYQLRFPLGIEKLINVVSIELSSCQLGKFSTEQIKDLFQELAQLPKLRKLDLSHNPELALLSDLKELPNVTRIDLSNNQLGSLSSVKLKQLFEYLSKLPNLVELDLSSNDLHQLPTAIGKLANLSILKLERNHLKTVPNEIGQLNNLTTLEVGHNNLSKLPSTIGSLTKLLVLDIHGNNLSSLPKEIGNLKSLKKLPIFGNKFRSMPKEIKNLPNLKKRSLNGENW